MSDENLINRSPLLPDRYPQGDFFVCDIFDAVPKADMASMEHPIFSLSTKPDTRVREYEHNGIKIAIKPSVDGLATVHDRDVRISAEPDSDFTKSRTAVSVSPGQPFQ